MSEMLLVEGQNGSIAIVHNSFEALKALAEKLDYTNFVKESEIETNDIYEGRFIEEMYCDNYDFEKQIPEKMYAGEDDEVYFHWDIDSTTDNILEFHLIDNFPMNFCGIKGFFLYSSFSGA